VGDKTKIAWTDATWNTVVGCSKASPGCANCYAEKLLSTRMKHLPVYGDVTSGGKWTGQTGLLPHRLDQPLRWKRPRKIFVNDLGDTFHPTVPFEFIAAIFGVAVACPQHTFQILTKRPGRMLEFFEWLSKRGPTATPLLNVWLGVTAEDQQRANERLPLLLKCPAAVRFVSAEPLLEAVDFRRWLDDPCDCGVPAMEGAGQHSSACQTFKVPWGLDWVIVGGESGPNARPCNVEWIRSIRDQCSTSWTAYFVKQLGANAIIDEQITVDEWRYGAPYVTSDRHGADPDEWPEDLRVREWPQLDGRVWSEVPEVG